VDGIGTKEGVDVSRRGGKLAAWAASAHCKLFSYGVKFRPRLKTFEEESTQTHKECGISCALRAEYFLGRR
jgi:hypothetical protein